MSHENPYAVSELYSHSEPARDDFDLLDPLQFRVEIPHIVCGQEVQLPEVCILSGESSDLVPAHKTIQLRSWKFEVYRRPCEVLFFLSRRRRRRMRYAFFGGFLIALAGIFFGVGFLRTQWPGPSMFAGVVMFFFGISIHLHGTLPLVMSRHERGRKFWLTGFSPAFFESLQRMPISRRMRDAAENHLAP